MHTQWVAFIKECVKYDKVKLGIAPEVQVEAESTMKLLVTEYPDSGPSPPTYKKMGPRPSKCSRFVKYA